MFGVNFGVVSAVFMGLVLFGLAYNEAFEYAERHGYVEGFTWVWVIGGVAITAGAIAILSWQAAIWALLGFAGSGLFMAVGAMKRYVTKRAAGQHTMRNEIRD